MNVLIVDDQPRIARVTALALEQLECRPLIARTTAEAGELLQKEKIDVLFLDVNLPGESGWDYLARLSARPQPLPVVIFTALSKEEAAGPAVQRGAFDCFVKPFTLEELRLQMDRVRQHLKQRQEGTHCP